jgi:pentatricopeptide repeat protein
VRETVHTYNALIAAYDRVGDYDSAMTLFKQLPTIGVAPNATTMQLVRFASALARWVLAP